MERKFKDLDVETIKIGNSKAGVDNFLKNRGARFFRNAILLARPIRHVKKLCSIIKSLSNQNKTRKIAFCSLLLK